MEPSSVTLCSPTQSVIEEEKWPENSTASPTFIVATDLNSDEVGSMMSVLSTMSETLLFQVETWTSAPSAILITPLPSPFEVSFVIFPTQPDALCLITMMQIACCRTFLAPPAASSLPALLYDALAEIIAEVNRV